MPVSCFPKQNTTHLTVYSHKGDSLRTEITTGKVTVFFKSDRKKWSVKSVNRSLVSFYTGGISHLANVHLVCVFTRCGSVGGEDGGAVAVGIIVD